MSSVDPPHPASAHTHNANTTATRELLFEDETDFDDARRGFIATLPDARVTNDNGEVVWDVSAYRFLEAQAVPESVNPSLWRQARLNQIHGLFHVAGGIYQVRGLDIANMTIIEGDTGILIIDPLMFSETAAAALALYYSERGERPVKAVMYSHSHPDHYGGVEGVISAAQVASGEVEVIAPAGFLEAALEETMLAGIPMRRRAMFQFGPSLEPGPRGQIDAGLGIRVGRGTSGLIAPNRLIGEAGETHVIDGVRIIFQLTPQTEAPAEMNFFFPAWGVLDLAENGCHTMHNLCPIRGARTRDALAWSKYLDEALIRFIDRTGVVIAQHHWPAWGREHIRRFISEQRDMYRYLHDQTLRLMSHGLTPNELAEAVAMPLTLEKSWHTRPYYGALAHNVRAIYAHYMGPYDGNPTHLHPLAPVAAGEKYIQYMGGADAVLDRARRDFDAGDYRWVVQVLHHAVFADPENRAARELAADAMEQLGYQAESATWRNAYLLGAKELRHGAPKPPPGGVGAISPKVVAMMPLAMLLDFLAIRINGQKADGLLLKLDWVMTDGVMTDGVMTDENSSEKGRSDTDHRRRLTLSHGALSHAPGSHGGEAQAVIRISRWQLTRLVNSGLPYAQAFDENMIPCEGDSAAARQLFALMDHFYPMFNIVEP
ncbi:MAG: MBL fold metallo-hydrolase [Gammaproteobacteria bacterium]|nr:MBL fold metallo-hydrolase [Gammaproteobacteria bacterium]